MTAETDLLPCPFCGDVEHLCVEHLEGTTIHPAYRVLCDHCGASTRYTDRDCRAAWNTRANVAHATAAKDAEIEALRAEVYRLQELCNGLHRSLTDSQAGFVHHRDRAERLAEALREYADPENWAMCEGKRRIWMEPRSSTPDAYHGHELACAALDQETTNG